MPNAKFTLNGKPVEASYESGMNFLEVLREECGVTSAKNGCSPEGACGCCVVLDGGRPVLTCLRKPENMDGHEITTMEGLQEDLRQVLGEAFAHEGIESGARLKAGFIVPDHDEVNFVFVPDSALIEGSDAVQIARHPLTWIAGAGIVTTTYRCKEVVAEWKRDCRVDFVESDDPGLRRLLQQELPQEVGKTLT